MRERKRRLSELRAIPKDKLRQEEIWELIDLEKLEKHYRLAKKR